MIVKVNPDLFDDPDNYQKLNYLFKFFETGKHILYLDQDITSSNWVINNQSKEVFCESEFKNSAYITNNEIQISINTINNLSNQEYSLDDGYILLDGQVIIFVENSTSDRLFLNAIFSNFNTECANIRLALKNRWIRFNGAGGLNEIKKEINNELRSFRSENLHNEKYLRGIVVLDSDKKYATESLSAIHQTIEDYCREKELSYHVLEKREVENYVPLEAFEDLEQHEIVKAYKTLSSTQQSFYDLEKGFDGIPFNNLKTEIKDFFSGINQDHIKTLRKGFKSIDGYKPKKNIPKLFNHKKVSRETLNNKCNNSNEFLEIIDKINKLL